MDRWKGLLSSLFIVFVLLDVFVLGRFLISGWPVSIDLVNVQKGVEEVHVIPIPITGKDWLVLFLVVGVQAFVCRLPGTHGHDGPGVP